MDYKPKDNFRLPSPLTGKNPVTDDVLSAQELTVLNPETNYIEFGATSR